MVDMDDFEEVKEDIIEVKTGLKANASELKWVYDTRFIMAQIRAKLYGGELIEDENGFYKMKINKKVKPMMNDTGIEETMKIISINITPIHALGILDDFRIREMTKVIALSLLKSYYLNMEKFDLEPIMAEQILRELVVLMEVNLSKSKGGKALIITLGNEQTREIRHEQPKATGFFARLRGK